MNGRTNEWWNERANCRCVCDLILLPLAAAHIFFHYACFHSVHCVTYYTTCVYILFNTNAHIHTHTHNIQIKLNLMHFICETIYNYRYACVHGTNTQTNAYVQYTMSIDTERKEENKKKNYASNRRSIYSHPIWTIHTNTLNYSNFFFVTLTFMHVYIS